jgi:peptide deformylase
MAKQTNEKANEPQVKQSKMDDMFTLVKTKDGVKIAVGNYQISKKTFQTWADAERYIAQKPYEILINATCLFTHLQFKNENDKTTKKDA